MTIMTEEAPLDFSFKKEASDDIPDHNPQQFVAGVAPTIQPRAVDGGTPPALPMSATELANFALSLAKSSLTSQKCSTPSAPALLSPPTTANALLNNNSIFGGNFFAGMAGISLPTSSATSAAPVALPNTLLSMLPILNNNNNMIKQEPTVTPSVSKAKTPKPIRPFKAYPKESLAFPLGMGALASTILSQGGATPVVSAQATMSSPTMVSPPVAPTQQPKPALFEMNNNNVTAPTPAAAAAPSSTEDLLKVYQEQLNKMQAAAAVGKSLSSDYGSDAESNPDSNNNSATLPTMREQTISFPGADGGEQSITINVTQPPPRKRPRALPDDKKDEAYWERRRKNNDAAKRSRDTRRAKEDEIAIRAAFLEQENLKLRIELAALKQENVRLRGGAAATSPALTSPLSGASSPRTLDSGPLA